MNVKTAKKLALLVEDAKKCLEQVFSVEKTLANELFGEAEKRNAHVAKALAAIIDLHAALQEAWSRAKGAEEAVLYAAKICAENMRNIAFLQKVVKESFLGDLADITACLDMLKSKKVHL